MTISLPNRNHPSRAARVQAAGVVPWSRRRMAFAVAVGLACLIPLATWTSTMPAQAALERGQEIHIQL